MLSGTNMNICQVDIDRYNPIVHILEGKYPAKAVQEMSRDTLEKLVTKLVQYTHEVAGTATKRKNNSKNVLEKPKWWPNGVVFNNPIKLGQQKNVKFTLKQLVIHCSQFFKNYQPKWLPTSCFWNDENRKKIKRRHKNRLKSLANLKNFRPPLEARREAPHLFQPMKPTPKPKTSPPHSSLKIEFLEYLALGNNKSKSATTAPSVSLPAKLSNHANIPFSSDVGKIMAAKENHPMTNDLKLRRLERSEWYTNKVVPTKSSEVDYEPLVVPFKEPKHSHVYKAPKRQYHHRRRSFYNAEFLAKFCTPVTVAVERLNLEEVVKKRRKLVVVVQDVAKLPAEEGQKPTVERPHLDEVVKKRRKLVVVVQDMYKFPAEEGRKPTKFRSSPRLRQ